ncbi:MAG TPA: 4Fe-4S ferredoxin, partial [Bacteroidales bacterium]
QASTQDSPSALTQWPVQMHLINPVASYFQGSDLLMAADCVAYSLGNFHSQFLQGKKLAIACPKLDSNKEIYLDKVIRLINDAKVNTITVMIMEVPCCGGLLNLVLNAAEAATRKVPVKAITVGIQGEILSEEWM